MIVTSIGFVTYGSQSVITGCMITSYVYVDEDEAEMVGNATNMTIGSTNHTENENMTSMINNSNG